MNYQLLIVDDELTIRKGLSEYIDWSAYGCTVNSVACNGKEAIEKLTENHIDIVITDVKMPLLDGIGLAKYISENQPEITVIILSGYAEFEYARSAIKYHVAQYLLKPVSKDQIISAVSETIQRKKSSALPQTVPVACTSSYSPFVENSIHFIREHLSEDISLELIAQNVHINESYLSRTFKKEYGTSIIGYLTELRIEKAKELLVSSNLRTFEISEAVGIHDPAYFSVLFKKFTGISPKAYRERSVTNESPGSH